MKNQYVADVNDYRKYGLLRELSELGKLRVGVCWMLTPNDGRTDGGKIRYKNSPEKWERYDSPVFKCLKECIENNERNVSQIELSGILPNAIFHPTVFTENRKKFWDSDVIFFDPDNGIEVKSCPTGLKNSAKYVYWPEITEAYGARKSVLVYQHFTREKRQAFIQRLASELHVRLPTAEVFSFRTPYVVFILASQPEHVQHFKRRADEVAVRWAKQIQVEHFVNAKPSVHAEVKLQVRGASATIL